MRSVELKKDDTMWLGDDAVGDSGMKANDDHVPLAVLVHPLRSDHVVDNVVVVESATSSRTRASLLPQAGRSFFLGR